MNVLKKSPRYLTTIIAPCLLLLACNNSSIRSQANQSHEKTQEVLDINYRKCSEDELKSMKKIGISKDEIKCLTDEVMKKI